MDVKEKQTNTEPEIDRIRAEAIKEGFAMGQQEERQRTSAILNLNISGAENIIMEALSSGANVQDTSVKIITMMKHHHMPKQEDYREPLKQTGSITNTSQTLYIPPIAESGLDSKDEKEINMLVKHMNAQVK